MTGSLSVVWEDWGNGTVRPTSRIRSRVQYDHPTLAEFCFQLEYNHSLNESGGPTDWDVVARFDHNIQGIHDVREEGLHMDLFPNTDQAKKVWNFRERPIHMYPQYCRDFLERHASHYLGRYERVVGIWPGDRYYD